MVENHNGAHFLLWGQNSNAYNLYIVGKEIKENKIKTTLKILELVIFSIIYIILAHWGVSF